MNILKLLHSILCGLLLCSCSVKEQEVSFVEGRPDTYKLNPVVAVKNAKGKGFNVSGWKIIDGKIGDKDVKILKVLCYWPSSVNPEEGFYSKCRVFVDGVLLEGDRGVETNPTQPTDIEKNKGYRLFYYNRTWMPEDWDIATLVFETDLGDVEVLIKNI